MNEVSSLFEDDREWYKESKTLSWDWPMVSDPGQLDVLDRARIMADNLAIEDGYDCE